VLSPLALKRLGSIPGLDWTQLSYIGQTYGAASALLTGLALIGVVGSIAFQARAIQADREQASRGHHAHLVEMALEDPAYQRCWGSDPRAHASSNDYRQQVYLNLIMTYWERDYVLGGFHERALRYAAARLFCGEAGRRFWADAGEVRAETSDTRRARRFCRIIDEEYQKAVALGPPAVSAEEPPPTPSNKDQQAKAPRPAFKMGSALLLGAVGGAVLSKFLWRRTP
jgi:hypothetical protein